jgi:hypothetical protein
MTLVADLKNNNGKRFGLLILRPRCIDAKLVDQIWDQGRTTACFTTQLAWVIQAVVELCPILF